MPCPAGHLSQFLSHSPPSAPVHRRPQPSRQGRSRTMAAIGERWPALLESVLGATPREFESRILRALTCANALAGHSETVLTWRFVSVFVHDKLAPARTPGNRAPPGPPAYAAVRRRPCQAPDRRLARARFGSACGHERARVRSVVPGQRRFHEVAQGAGSGPGCADRGGGVFRRPLAPRMLGPFAPARADGPFFPGSPGTAASVIVDFPGRTAENGRFWPFSKSHMILVCERVGVVSGFLGGGAVLA
jgi:hypothetical protein